MNDSTVYTLVTKTGTSTGAGTAVNFANAEGVLVSAVAATASSSTILIQGSMDNSVWKTLATITDVGAEPDGTAYTGNSWPYIRANVSAHASGGTITVTAVALDYAPGYWNLVTRAVDAAGALTVTSLTDSGLTSGRVPYASTGGLLADEAAFAYNAGTNTLTVGSLIDSALTATRVTFAGASKELADAAGLTWDGSYLSATSIKDAAATATYVPYAGASKQLAYDSTFNFDATTKALSATILKGGVRATITAKASNGAIASAPGVIAITKGSALGSSTLATPTATDHDGYVLTIVATTAHTHSFDFASGKVNGGALTTATFGGAIGDGLTMVAYQGVWYVISNINVTLS